MNMYCIKYIIGGITKPFVYLCDLSFSAGIFPDEMKIARVIPIYINKNEFNNYTPIYILPKIFQKSYKNIKKRISKYIETFILLPDNQYRIREGYPTAMALTDLVDNIATAIYKKIIHNISICRP